MNKRYKIVFYVSIISLVMVDICIGLEQLWRRKFKMFGDLQGVGFRNFSKRVANELGLHGYAQHEGFMMSGVVEGTEDQLNKWTDRMVQGYNLTGKGTAVFSKGIRYYESDAITRYKYRNFTIRRNKPIIDEMVLRSQSARDFYQFTDEEIEM